MTAPKFALHTSPDVQKFEQQNSTPDYRSQFYCAERSAEDDYRRIGLNIPEAALRLSVVPHAETRK